MATVYSDQYSAAVPVNNNLSAGKGLKALCGTYEIATALSKDDLLAVGRLPHGAVVIGGWLQCDDLDTGAEALEVDVGTSDDPDKFLDSGVITGDAVGDHVPAPAAGMAVFLHFNGTVPYTVVGDTDVYAKIVAAATAGGTGTVTVVVLFLVP